MLSLLDTWDVWVKRRVETIELLDSATCARRVSVDFELPMDIVASASSTGQGEESAQVLVPLTLVPKRVLTAFSLRDESGHALALSTRDTAGAIGTAVLARLAEALFSDDLGELPWGLVGELSMIATRPHSLATDLLRDLQAPRKGEPPADVEWRQRLARSEPFTTMASDLARNTLLITRIAAEPGRRRIIKFGYEDAMMIRAAQDEPRISQRVDALRRRVGWAAHEITVETAAVGLADCYHLEFRAPSGFHATRGGLRAYGQDMPEADRGYPNSSEAVGGDKLSVHLHASAPAGSTGEATIFLRPHLSTILAPATLVATMTTLLLFVIAARSRYFQANIGMALAVLLVPGGLAAYVAYVRTEARIVNQLLAGLRLVALTSGLWAFLAALTLLSAPTWDGTTYVIGVWAVGSLLTLAVLLRAAHNTLRPPERREHPPVLHLRDRRDD